MKRHLPFALKSMRFAICISPIFVAVILKSDAQSYTNLNEDGFKAMMKSIEPWPGWGTNYSNSNWVQLVVVAKVIKKESPQTIEKLLRQYQMDGSTNQNFQTFNEEQIENDTKLYLLMRTVFDLPEKPPADKQITIFDNWTGRWMKTNGKRIRMGRLILRGLSGGIMAFRN